MSVHLPEAVVFPYGIYIRSGAKRLAWEFDISIVLIVRLFIGDLLQINLEYMLIITKKCRYSNMALLNSDKLIFVQIETSPYCRYN